MMDGLREGKLTSKVTQSGVRRICRKSPGGVRNLGKRAKVRMDARVREGDTHLVVEARMKSPQMVQQVLGRRVVIGCMLATGTKRAHTVALEVLTPIEAWLLGFEANARRPLTRCLFEGAPVPLRKV